MAGIGIGGTSGATTDKEPQRTEGGYLKPQYRSGPSATGLYRQTPRGNVPIRKREYNNPLKDSPYTYRGMEVPMYSGSELIGLPSGASAVKDGMTAYAGTLRNTQTDLDRILNFRSPKVRELQTQLYKMGWIGKNSITGKASTESFQGAIAFLMAQGNEIGMNWEEVMNMGPAGLESAGGPSVTGGGRNGPAYGVKTTQTNTATNEVTKGTAKAYLKDALANVLGRGPQPGEFNEFLDMLRDKEEANPSVTVGTSVVNSETDSESTTDTSGGMNEADYQQFAERFARQQDPGQAKRYQRAGYEQILDQLIAGG